jgi:hypothetical protein
MRHPVAHYHVEALRDRELPPGNLLSQLQIEQANRFQHPAALRAKQVVVGPRVGNPVHYTKTATRSSSSCSTC